MKTSFIYLTVSASVVISSRILRMSSNFASRRNPQDFLSTVIAFSHLCFCNTPEKHDRHTVAIKKSAGILMDKILINNIKYNRDITKLIYTNNMHEKCPILIGKELQLLPLYINIISTKTNRQYFQDGSNFLSVEILLMHMIKSMTSDAIWNLYTREFFLHF